MWAHRAEDDTLPVGRGGWALWHDQPRPPLGVRDEIFVVDPTGCLFALIPEVHRWTIDEDSTISVTPSIVSPRGYHGFLTCSLWSP